MFITESDLCENNLILGVLVFLQGGSPGEPRQTERYGPSFP